MSNEFKSFENKRKIEIRNLRILVNCSIESYANTLLDFEVIMKGEITEENGVSIPLRQIKNIDCCFVLSSV